jgi:hypothetical protein
LDDGGVFMVVLKALLAFTDVGLFEAVTWARWGTTKWVQKQPRGFSDNAYFPIDTKNTFPKLTHGEFVQCISPSIHEKATDAHIDALLKRTAYLVVAPNWVAWRPAGPEHVEVNRQFRDDLEFLTQEGKDLYGKYIDGVRTFPPNHEENLKLEQLWVNRVLAKNRKRRLQKFGQLQIRGAPLFADVQVSATTAIKKEKAAGIEKKFANLKKNPIHEIIDLSPSPDKKKQRGEEDHEMRVAMHESLIVAGMSTSSAAPVAPGSNYISALDNPDFEVDEADMFLD